MAETAANPEQIDVPLVRQWRSPAKKAAKSRASGGGALLPQRLDVYAEFFAPASGCRSVLAFTAGFQHGTTVGFSSDGRHAYCFSVYAPPDRLIVVDLLLNIQLAFRFDATADALVHNFVVVNATTIVLHDGESLWLLRLNVDELRVERTLLEQRAPTVVLTEIRGANVRVKRAVLNASGSVPLRFARLDVDDGRLEGDGEAEFPQEQPPFGLSEDGRSLYSFFFEYNHRPRLHVLDVETKTRSTVDPAGDIEMMEECNVFWSPRHAYINGWAFIKWKRRFLVYSCDLERREWTKLPVITREPVRISPVLDATSGEDRGNFLVVCKAEKRIGLDDYAEEVRVYRPLRHPPRLVTLAADALRKSRIDVDGEWGFHGCMAKTPCNRLLPPLFPNMMPIPRLNRVPFVEETLQLDDSQLPAWRSGTASR